MRINPEAIGLQYYVLCPICGRRGVLHKTKKKITVEHYRHWSQTPNRTYEDPPYLVCELSSVSKAKEEEI